MKIINIQSNENNQPMANTINEICRQSMSMAAAGSKKISAHRRSPEYTYLAEMHLWQRNGWL
jgi:hypothetical protein